MARTQILRAAAAAAACLTAGAHAQPPADTPPMLAPPSILSESAVGAAYATPPNPSGASGSPLSMRAAVDQAVNWHPLLRNARGQLLQATQGIETARSGYYPNVSAGVNARNSNHTIGDTDSRHERRAEIQISQVLYDFGKVGSEVDQATAASGAARAQVLQTFDQVILNTAAAWIEVSRNEALLKVAREQAEVLATLSQRVQERDEKGAGTSSDTAQARARVDAARAALLTAQSQVRLWRTTLMYWTGSATPPGITGAPAPALAGACRAGAAALTVGGAEATLQSSAAVQLAQAQLEVARAGLALADAQMKPTLSLTGSTGRRLGGSDGRDDGRNLDASIMLNFSVPLYQGGRLQSGRQAAGYGVGAARAALDQARLNTSQGWESATLQWLKFSGRLDVQAARQKNMDITRTLYRDQYLQLGTRSLLDLLNAEQEYYASLNDQIESEHEMVRLDAECLYYTGRLRDAFETGGAVARTVAAPDTLQ
ncbi:TolC family outer membrane protein [Castellaniella hirudinis]|uniref:TolC family outer membrane protein n=1 Tax=Castellaniella hirudinis TaxID=1144617 RepID=A0ABV8S1D6_9BURK